MTTILFSKPGNVPYPIVTIYAGKIQEQIEKKVVEWGDFRASAQWPSPPTAINPSRSAIDFLLMKRIFTITGRIDVESTGGATVQHARDAIVNMLRSGGNVNFSYGINSDATSSGYSPSANDLYYETSAFVGYITRLMISEEPKGGNEQFTAGSGPDTKMPEYYDVTITFIQAIETGA